MSIGRCRISIDMAYTEPFPIKLLEHSAVLAFTFNFIHIFSLKIYIQDLMLQYLLVFHSLFPFLA